jgi:hypothetical protein
MTPMKMKRVFRLYIDSQLVYDVFRLDRHCLPLYETLSFAVLDKLLPDLTSAVKEISHETVPQIPLEGLGQGVFAKADVSSLLTIVLRRWQIGRRGWSQEMDGNPVYHRVRYGESDP